MLVPVRLSRRNHRQPSLTSLPLMPQSARRPRMPRSPTPCSSPAWAATTRPQTRRRVPSPASPALSSLSLSTDSIAALGRMLRTIGCLASPAAKYSMHAPLHTRVAAISISSRSSSADARHRRWPRLSRAWHIRRPACARQHHALVVHTRTTWPAGCALLVPAWHEGRGAGDARLR